MDNLNVFYIEPNDLEFHNEDLCIGVNLTVEIPKRGLAENNNIKLSWTANLSSNDLNAQDLMSGVNGYLTTSYTDVSCDELNSGGNLESIGIESINIRYNSWFYPEVTVKFIDLRGNALMNPEENRRDSNKNGTGTFFSALYSFPYPVFKLTVKGQLGKPVTFNLAVRDTISSLNASTGNFEVTVKFIGYMYGYMTDIPMKYLMIAPYCDYDGDTTKNLGEFSDYDANSNGKIPTLIDFMSTMSECISTANKNSDYQTQLKWIKSAEEEYKKLTEIKDSIESLENTLAKYNNGNSYPYVETRENGNLIIRTVYSNDNQEIRDGNNEIWEAIRVVKEKAVEQDIRQLTINEFRTDSSAVINWWNADETGTTELEFNIKKDQKFINDKINTAKDNIDRRTAELNKSFKDIVSINYDWDMTIRNIFIMVLAHLQRFYSLMHRCLGNIQNQGLTGGRRLPSGMSGTFDCRPVDEKAFTVPPFPAVTNSSNEYIWFDQAGSSDAELNNYEERNFIESLYRAVTLQVSEAAASAGFLNSITQWGNYQTIPSLLSDVYYDEDYYSGANLEQILDTLAKRIVARYLFSSGDKTNTLDIGEFAAIEAFNIINNNLNINDLKELTDFLNVPGKIKLFGQKCEAYAKSIGNIMADDDEAKIPINVKYWVGNETGIRFNEFYENEPYLAKDKESGNWQVYNVLIAAPENYSDRQFSSAQSIQKFEGWSGLDNLANSFAATFPQTDSIKTTYYDNDSCFRMSISDTYTTSYVTINGGEKDSLKLTINYNGQSIGYYSEDKFDKFESKSVENAIGGLANSQELDANISFSNSNIRSSFFAGIWRQDETAYKKLLGIWKKKTGLGEDDLLIFLFMCNIGYTYYSDIDLTKYGIHRLPEVFLMFMGVMQLLINNGDIISISCIDSEAGENSMIQEQTIRDRIHILGEASKNFISNYYKENRSSFAKTLRYLLGENKAGGNKPPKENKDKRLIKYIADFDDEQLRTYKELFSKDILIFSITASEQKILPEKLANASFSILTDNGQNDSYNAKNPYSQVQIVIDNYYNSIESDQAEIAKRNETMASRENKLGTYLSIKNLYDRWKFGVSETETQSSFTVNMKDFVFVDSLYRDKGDMQVNPEKIVNLIRNIILSASDVSLYQFLQEICEACDMQLTALPVNIFETINNEEALKNLFKPIPYLDAQRTGSTHTTYVAVHKGKPSQHLAMVNNYAEYPDDGIDFIKENINAKPARGNSVSGGIPAFGVTYAMGKQHVFTNLSVGSDSPQNTAQSIMAELDIAQQGSKTGAAHLGFIDHSLYDIYANRSYTCKVEMLGCAQMVPMLYFQLNNVPMFKGGYMITNVEHNITRGGMKTSFTGVRIARNTFNMDNNGLNLNQMVSDITIPNDGSAQRTIKTNASGLVYATGQAADTTPYSSGETWVLIDAGHNMTTPGKQSPKIVFATNNTEYGWLEIARASVKNQQVTFTGLHKNTDYQIDYQWIKDGKRVHSKISFRTGPNEIYKTFRNLDESVKTVYLREFKRPVASAESDGILLKDDALIEPRDIEGNRVLQFYGGKYDTRYREYWGNRLMAAELDKQLEAAGIKHMVISGNLSEDDKGYGTNYRSNLEKAIKECNGNCIIISLHSNAASKAGWSDTNFWQIFYQDETIHSVVENGVVTKKVKVTPEKCRTSFNLAKKIVDSVKKVQKSVKSSPYYFEESEQGIRPLDTSGGENVATVLIEGYFHTSKEGVKNLSDSKFRQALAACYVEGIKEFFKEYDTARGN